MSETRARTSPVGRHLPTSGGLVKTTVSRAEAQGCEAVQVFVSNPQAWSEPTGRPDAEEFVREAASLGISPVVVHAKYLINLASTREDQREKSIEALAHEAVASGALGARFTVVHSGSHGGEGEEVGLERLISGLIAAKERAAELAAGRPVATIAVENSCGAGAQLCSDVESLARVASEADVGTCVDTCHAYVAGYDLTVSEVAAAFGVELREKLGERLSLIHFNDAKNELGSHRDGHARIGEGAVPLQSWEAFLAELPGVPVVMETPYDTPEVDAAQVSLAKKLAGGLRVEGIGI